MMGCLLPGRCFGSLVVVLDAPAVLSYLSPAAQRWGGVSNPRSRCARKGVKNRARGLKED